MKKIFQWFVAILGFVFGLALILCLFFHRLDVHGFDAVLTYAFFVLSIVFCFSFGYATLRLK